MSDLENLLEEVLPYLPKIYTQSSYTPTMSDSERDFNLIYKFSKLPSDCLIFFVPTQSSVDGTNTLVIKVPSSSTGENVTYTSYRFTIVTETNDGNTRPAKAGDIIAYRMCTFRFAKGNTNVVILTNSPSYNSLQVSNLVATNAKFLNVPSVGGTPISTEKLVVATELTKCADRIEKLEEKIIYGVTDPEEALASKPNGTIYIQIEEE